MLKNLTELVVKINDREYRFSAPQDSPIADCKEAVFQFLKLFGQIEDNSKSQCQPSDACNSTEEKNDGQS